jgi:hypothetical protein
MVLCLLRTAATTRPARGADRCGLAPSRAVAMSPHAVATRHEGRPGPTSWLHVERRPEPACPLALRDRRHVALRSDTITDSSWTQGVARQAANSTHPG